MSEYLALWVKCYRSVSPLIAIVPYHFVIALWRAKEHNRRVNYWNIIADTLDIRKRRDYGILLILARPTKMPIEIKKEIELEIAHVLFIDIVGYRSFRLATSTRRLRN